MGGMAKKKHEKGAGSTPATVQLEKAGVPFKTYEYAHSNDHMDDGYGVEAATKLGFDEHQVFKTLMADTGSERVVGVVPDGRYSSLSESPRSFAFLSAPQWERAEFTLFIRSVLPPTDLREVLRIQTDELLPGLPAPRLASFEATARVSIMPQLVLASATSVLGGLALTLAATGLYGVLAFQVANRVREFGVRMALGAQAARIAVQVGGTLLWWLLPGVALGLLLGHGATQAAGQFLLGPGSTDPAAIPIALGLFALMALIATGVPLARILRLRPGEALRAE